MSAGRPARGALVALAVVAPGAAAAQPGRGAGLVPEARAESAVGRDPAAVVGAGVLVDAGLYARVGVVASAGAAWVDHPGGRRARGAGEAALVARFLLDPLRQARRGVYAGGGLGVRTVGGAAARPFLLGTLGVEGGRTRAGVAPAVEVGVGAGVRVAVVLRRARAGRR